MEYCYRVWAGAPSCYLELLDKLQKRICGTVGPSLPSSLERLVHRQYVASLSLFYRYYIQWLIQAVLDMGILILGTLTWACPNLILSRTETNIKRNSRFLIESATC